MLGVEIGSASAAQALQPAPGRPRHRRRRDARQNLKLTDAVLAWPTRSCSGCDGSRSSHVVASEQEFVVEIAFDGVQTRPALYGGVALRFAAWCRCRGQGGVEAARSSHARAAASSMMVASGRTKSTSRITTTPAVISRVFESSCEQVAPPPRDPRGQRLHVERSAGLRQVLSDVLQPALQGFGLGALALRGRQLPFEARRAPLSGLRAHERRGQLPFEPHDLVRALDRARLMRRERLEPPMRVGEFLPDPLALARSSTSRRSSARRWMSAATPNGAGIGR